MINLIRSKFQAHPFHLVSPSPWPIFTCVSLLTLTTSGVLTMHGFHNAEYFLILAFISLISSMSFWFRDVISEGKPKNILQTILSKNILKIAKAITHEQIKEMKDNNIIRELNINKDELGFYLAGLLEGDGHISLPFLGNTILNRILNPRIVFTSHTNNIELYVNIQSKLGGIGRFQLVNQNTFRYIIGDIKSIILFINIVHDKLRTPKNESFNQLINFLNLKYNMAIPKSNIDISDFSSNSWFTGFTEADGHFGVKIVDSKPKSCTRIRSVSDSISLKFRLDQRLYDKKTSLSMKNIMEKLAQFLSCKLSVYESKNNKILSLNVVSIEKIKFIIEYFSKYPLLGTKNKDFKDWETVYYTITSKEHLTETGRLKIKLIQSSMNSKRIQEYNKFLLSKSQISLSILFVLLVSFIILDFFNIINLDSFLSTINSNYFICMVDDDPNSIKGTLEVNNVKLENLDTAIEKIRDGTIYIGGMAATARIVKSSSLPVGAKLGSILGMGAASLIGYHMVQNNLGRNSGTLNLKAENLSTTISASNSNNSNDIINKFIGGVGKSNDNNTDFVISSLDLEQLQLDFYLHLVMLYLFIILFMIIIMKYISKRNYKFEFILKLPYGEYIQIIFIKLFNWWDKTNDIWIYLILSTVFISLIISAWSIYIIINNIH